MVKFGHRLRKARKIGHRSLHKISVGARHIEKGSDVGGRILKKVGKATGQEELVMAGGALQEGGRMAGKVGRVSRSLEKII